MKKIRYDGMTKVKVLPLTFWMSNSSDFKDDLGRLESTAPVFNRNGHYYNRVLDVCWFEVDGKAFLFDGSDFKWDLECLCARELNHKQIMSLMEVQTQDLSTKQQDRILYMYTHSMKIREAYRGARKTLHRMSNLHDSK